MTAIQALPLGLVRGLTESLPFSSIAHLRVIPALLGGRTPEPHSPRSFSSER